MHLAGSESLSGNAARAVFVTALGKELLRVGGVWVWRDSGVLTNIQLGVATPCFPPPRLTSGTMDSLPERVWVASSRQAVQSCTRQWEMRGVSSTWIACPMPTGTASDPNHLSL